VYAATRVPVRGRVPRLLFRTSIAASALLVVLSLSRAITVALVLGAALWPIRSLVTGRLSRKTARLALLSAPVVVGGVVLGVGSVIWNRFAAQPGSYAARTSALSASVDTNPLLGGAAQAQVSAHNFVLDSWSRGGVLPALAAAAAVVALVWVWWQLAATAVGAKDEIGGAKRHLVVAALGVLPIVRLMTAGGGILHLTEWLALGFFGATRLMPERESMRPPRPAAPR